NQHAVERAVAVAQGCKVYSAAVNADVIKLGRAGRVGSVVAVAIVRRASGGVVVAAGDVKQHAGTADRAAVDSQTVIVGSQHHVDAGVECNGPARDFDVIVNPRTE